MTFEEMNLSPELMNGLRDVHFEKPTDIQKTVIPKALEGKDILVNNTVGEGKYGSFIIPSLEKLTQTDSEEKKNKGTQILVLTPHHEDAQSIDELFWAMGYHAQVECATVGMEGDWDEQEQMIREGIQVLVANPGRVLEILEKQRIVLRDVDLFILDNMDEMISLGLSEKVKDIKKRVMSDYQAIGYAGALSDEVSSLQEYIMTEPELIGFEGADSVEEKSEEPSQSTTEVDESDEADEPVEQIEQHEPPKLTGGIKQGYIKVPNRMKITTLMAHIDETPTETCVIFTASKRGTDRLYRVLRKRNYSATSLHGKLSEEKRAQRFANFSNGDVQFLLVSDISASDLGLNSVMQVINYDVPNDADEYRYRAGLVSDGKAGRIVSLVSKQDRSDINQLKNELGEAPEELELPDEVKKKLEERKKKSSGKSKSRGGNRSSNQSKGNNGSRSRSKQKRGSRDKKKRGGSKGKELELPKPSYDKLSGGRSGNVDEKEKGVIKFFKKLFTS